MTAVWSDATIVLMTNNPAPVLRPEWKYLALGYFFICEHMCAHPLRAEYSIRHYKNVMLQYTFLHQKLYCQFSSEGYQTIATQKCYVAFFQMHWHLGHLTQRLQCCTVLSRTTFRRNYPAHIYRVIASQNFLYEHWVFERSPSAASCISRT